MNSAATTMASATIRLAVVGAGSSPGVGGNAGGCINGAGKTTVIKCLLGLLHFKGAIRVDGLDVRRQGRAVRQRIGYVPQELAFYKEMTAFE
ncbi:MAG: hypothetical protein CUN48_17615, partial [Candidatus Thermofonsia Clade 3 bacterium]